jgi:hypothetical protein
MLISEKMKIFMWGRRSIRWGAALNERTLNIATFTSAVPG